MSVEICLCHLPKLQHTMCRPSYGWATAPGHEKHHVERDARRPAQPLVTRQFDCMMRISCYRKMLFRGFSISRAWKGAISCALQRHGRKTLFFSPGPWERWRVAWLARVRFYAQRSILSVRCARTQCTVPQASVQCRSDLELPELSFGSPTGGSPVRNT